MAKGKKQVNGGEMKSSVETYWWCINDECLRKQRIVRMKEEGKEDEAEYCNDCGAELKLAGFRPTFVGKFSGLSRQEKQAVLKKRSKDHYERLMKDERIERNRKAGT